MKTIAYSLTALLTIFTSACGGAPDSDTMPVEPANPLGGDQPDEPSSAPTQGHVDAGWHSLAPLARGPRTETTAVALNGRIAVIGGFDQLTMAVPDIELYDPAAKRWDIMQPLPKALHHVSAAVVSGRLYILGGLEGTGDAANGEGYVFYPATGEWHSIAAMPAGSERAGSAVGVIGTYVYIAGGVRDGKSVADFSAYDTETDTWKELPPLPEARGYLTGGAVGEVFYAVGGQMDGDKDVKADVFAYNPEKGEWSARAPMQTPRSSAAAGVVGERLFVVGGSGHSDLESGLFDVNEVYDPATDTWTKLDRMMDPRRGMGAASYEGALYVAGGAAKKVFGAVDTFDTYIVK